MLCSSTCTAGTHHDFCPCLQIALLYPLDTIKVRCQTNSCSAAATLAQVAAQSKGNLLAALALLYAGAIPAAATSILVGSVHYVCFCATKRAVLNLPGFSSSTSSSTSSTAGSSGTAATTKSSSDSAATSKVAAVTPAASAAAGAGGDDEAEQQPSTTTIIMSHGLTGSHFHLVQECEPDTEQLQEAAASSTSTSLAAHGASAAGSAAGATPAGAAAGVAAAATSSEEGAAADADGRMAANVLSAILTAAITALVESPLELFRHNSQAGQCQPNFVAEMWRVRREGMRRDICYQPAMTRKGTWQRFACLR